MSQFYQRLIQLILAFLFIIGVASNIITVTDYFKKSKLLKMKVSLQNPYINPLIWSLAFTTIIVILFFLFGGFNFIKAYLHSSENSTTLSKKEIPNVKIDKVDTTKTNIPNRSIHKKLKSNSITNINSMESHHGKVDTSKSKSTQDNSITVQGNDNHVVGGSNNHVGVNGDVYTGIKQRHVNEAVLTYLSQNIPANRDCEIGFEVHSMSDRETMNYVNEIDNVLQHNGYKNINRAVDTSIGLDGVDSIFVRKEGDKYIIHVYPASNVK